MIGSHLIGILLLVWVFIFYNIPAILWLVTATLITFGFYSLGSYSLLSCIIGYAVFLVSYSCLAIKSIRRNLITNSLIDFFKKQLPQISDTEEQAIEAGDVWWEGNLFSANINWNKIQHNKLKSLTDEEQSFLDNETEELCQLIDEWQVASKDKDLSRETWNYLKKNKFFSIAISKEYGGLGFSATAQSCIVTRVATKSLTAAVTIMVPNALGPGELLMHYGTKEQKDHYLPRLANTEEIPCFALTSPHGGSDAGSMNDTGVICKQLYNGKETLGIKLNFAKRYITLAPVATLMGLAFKLYDPDNLFSAKKDLGITLALIPTNHPGINIGNRHYAMFCPFQNGPISGRDVFIPMEFIIGGTDYIGKGWYMLMECLSGGRGISLPALSTSTMQTSYLTSSAYACLRKQFKVPLVKLEGIQEQLAKISGITLIANAVRLVTTSAIDSGLKPAVVSGMAKYHMTEFARTAINSAMDIHAGKGVMNGPNNYLTSQYISSPIAITVEGANILTRNLIIFGQGAFRAHPYVLKELKALQELNKNYALSSFDTVLFKHIKFVLRNKIRLITYSLQRVYYPILKKSSWLKAYQKDINRMSTALAFTTDMALLFIGGKLKFKERMSARLGDVASNLYMSLCVINYYSDLASKHSNNKEFMANLDFNTQWALDYLLCRSEEALAEFMRNFSLRPVAWGMKFLIMPWGRSYKPPKDNLESHISLNSMVPGDYYKCMTELCHKKNSVLGEVYATFVKQDELKPLLDKLEGLIRDKKISGANDLNLVIQQAYDNNLIDNSENDKLKRYADAVDKIIKVDDFDSLVETTSVNIEMKKPVLHEVVSDN